MSENTLEAYRKVLDSLAISQDAELNAAALAEYITQLHPFGKSPSTIAQMVAAVESQAKNLNRSDVVGAITQADTGRRATGGKALQHRQGRWSWIASGRMVKVPCYVGVRYARAQLAK